MRRLAIALGIAVALGAALVFAILAATKPGIAEREGAAPAASSAGPGAPPDAEIRKIVAGSLGALAAALETGDFAELHARLSTPFRKQVAAAKLAKTFEPLRPKAPEIRRARDVAPVLDAPPAIDERGVLVLRGHVPTEPERVTFVLKYVLEEPEWRLLGLNVDVVPGTD